jgi:prevent-host-death family protein
VEHSQAARLGRRARVDATFLEIHRFCEALHFLSILSVINIRTHIMEVTSTEFQQNIGRYQDAALAGEPVVVTKNGRRHTVLLSAAMFEVLVRGRIARPVEELDADKVEAIAKSKVAPEYAALDDLIRDWSP